MDMQGSPGWCEVKEKEHLDETVQRRTWNYTVRLQKFSSSSLRAPFSRPRPLPLLSSLNALAAPVLIVFRAIKVTYR